MAERKDGGQRNTTARQLAQLVRDRDDLATLLTDVGTDNTTPLAVLGRKQYAAVNSKLQTLVERVLGE